MSKKILTLNIGASTVELAEYELGGSSVRLVNYGTAALAAPLDSGDAETILGPALMEIVREKGIRPGRVAVSISGQMAFPRIAAIPMAGSDQDRFEQLVRYEIEQNVPFPIDEMVCDRQVLGDTENGDKSVLIVAAKVDQVEAITGALTSAGFSPEIIGVAPFSVVNALRAGREDDGSCTIILDIGAKTTSLVISEGEKFYNRSIPVAGNAITKEIAQTLGCTMEEAEQYKVENAYVSVGGVVEDEDETRESVAKVCRAVMTRLNAEISRSINFYRSQQGGGVPTRLYLTGGTSVMPQLAEFFGEALGIEVEPLNPFESVEVDPSIDADALSADAALLAATAGLAMQAGGFATINVNLMPQSILAAKAEVARIPFVAIGAVGLVAAAAVWLVAALGRTSEVESLLEPAMERASSAKATKSACDAAWKDYVAATNEATRLEAELKRRDAALRHMETVRVCMDPHIWIASWIDTPEKRVVEDVPARGRIPAQTHEEIVSTTRITFRCWADEQEAIGSAFREYAKEKEERGEKVECDVDTTAKSPLEIVKYRLAATGRCEILSDSQRNLGPGDSLLQFSVSVKFKEAPRK